MFFALIAKVHSRPRPGSNTAEQSRISSRCCFKSRFLFCPRFFLPRFWFSSCPLSPPSAASSLYTSSLAVDSNIYSGLMGANPFCVSSRWARFASGAIVFLRQTFFCLCYIEVLKLKREKQSILLWKLRDFLFFRIQCHPVFGRPRDAAPACMLAV